MRILLATDGSKHGLHVTLDYGLPDINAFPVVDEVDVQRGIVTKLDVLRVFATIHDAFVLI